MYHQIRLPVVDISFNKIKYELNQQDWNEQNNGNNDGFKNQEEKYSKMITN